MNQTFRTAQMLAVSALLLGAVAIAQPETNNASNPKSTEHHGRFSRVAFWRHHNDVNKNAKQDQSRTAPVKPAAAKESPASKTQVKAVSAKPPASKIAQNQKTTKPAATYSAKKTTAKAPSAQPKNSPQKSMTAQNTQPKDSLTK